MINNKCFTEEWIKAKSAAIGSRNPVMLEKATLALQLLGELAECELQFQFKGGTSLLLRLNPIRRLSIDVDIVTQSSPGGLLKALKKICSNSLFTGYQHDALRDKDLPPKKHFKVFYQSVIEPKQDHILLDVLFEKEPSPCCDSVLISTPFIETEREVFVSVPTVNSLLGDKLTAFAPNTIGILYNKSRKTDIVKQLFDVGALFDAATDLDVVAEVYEYIHGKQIKYRNNAFTVVDTLNDTITAGFLYTQLDLRGGIATEQGVLLKEGVSSLQNHLINLPFNRDDARVAAGKAACLAAWIQRRDTRLEPIPELRFEMNRVSELRDKQILAPWVPLNRLKGGNLEAFYYWYQAQRILTAQC